MSTVQQSAQVAPATVDMPLAAGQPTWLRWCVGALALALLLTIAVPLLLPDASRDHTELVAALTWAHRIIAATLGLITVAWFVSTQRGPFAARNPTPS